MGCMCRWSAFVVSSHLRCIFIIIIYTSLIVCCIASEGCGVVVYCCTATAN